MVQLEGLQGEVVPEGGEVVKPEGLWLGSPLCEVEVVQPECSIGIAVIEDLQHGGPPAKPEVPGDLEHEVVVVV